MICSRCFREYDEMGMVATPMDELGQIFLDSVSVYGYDLLCPACREELGMLNILGFQS